MSPKLVFRKIVPTCINFTRPSFKATIQTRNNLGQQLGSRRGVYFRNSLFDVSKQKQQIFYLELGKSASFGRLVKQASRSHTISSFPKWSRIFSTELWGKKNPHCITITSTIPRICNFRNLRAGGRLTEDNCALLDAGYSPLWLTYTFDGQ